MKVEFSASSLHSIPQNRNVGLSYTKRITQSNLRSEPLGPVVRISFKGNSKNYHQFASIAPEDKGLGIPEYSRGGLAVVAQEAPESWSKHLHADVRNFLPYHSYGNKEGGIRVVKTVLDKDGKMSNYAPAENFMTVCLDYDLKEGEVFAIQSEPIKGVSKFVPLEKMEVRGSVTSLSNRELKGLEVPYQFFKAILPDDKGVTRYIIHMEHLARFSKAYGGKELEELGGGGVYGGAYGRTYGGASSSAYGGKKGAFFNTDAFYSDFTKAIANALPKLNKQEHGNFNPANIWAHDRFGIPILVAVTEVDDPSQYYTGIRFHCTYHNPGRPYQGVYDNPLDFFRIVAGDKAIQDMIKSPSYKRLKEIDSKVLSGTASKEDIEEAAKILEPVIGKFKDSLGTYNMTKIAIVGTEENPFNMTSGTVSRNYGHEMKSHNTFSIADGLTDEFAKIVTINITNGSTPANLGIDNPNAGFGPYANLLNEDKANFSTYKPVFDEAGNLTNIDEIMAAKKNNAKWLINLIANADPNDKYGVEKIFFDEAHYSPENGEKSTVIGKLSAYEEGDKLILGWGRPDPQKGYPTSFEAFLKFLKSPDISEETKKHTKLIIGAGKETWPENARDWKNIQRLVKEIQNYDGGKYKGNVMYVNGLFPNRLVGCAHSTLFTSVFEPCGITPLESFSAGTPVTSINTGGAPDFITSYSFAGHEVKNETGFLTKNPYLKNPEAVGVTVDMLAPLDDAAKFELVDDKRRAMASDEVTDCLKQMVGLDEQNYKQMTINAFKQKVDWHNNNAYNGGLSANTRYMREAFHLDENGLKPLINCERFNAKLNRMLGDYYTGIQNFRNEVVSVVKSTKTGKVFTALAVGVVAAGTGAIVYFNGKKAQNKKSVVQTQQTQTVAAQKVVPMYTPQQANRPAIFSKII